MVGGQSVIAGDSSATWKPLSFLSSHGTLGNAEAGTWPSLVLPETLTGLACGDPTEGNLGSHSQL